MISTSNVSLSFGGKKLFEDVNIKFTPGNCYGLIGANGAGKSTFIKVLSGEVEPNTGSINITPGERLSILKQDHFAYEEEQVLQAVLMGNEKLFSIMKEKDAIYMKEDFSDEDGMKAAELESEFAEMNGYEAESEAGILLSGLGIGTEYHYKYMKELTGPEKVKVLLAQALFGSPDILLLDEPTNNLDIKAIQWLENFLLNYEKTVIVVSHDRHFLNKVCTHIADIDFGKITTYAGNYDFWRKSSELAQRLRADQNKKAEDKAKELKAFIQRFSANASKSSQATSRQKQLEKLELTDLPQSTRKYPFVQFDPKREAGKEILRVEGISKTIDGVKLLDNVTFMLNKDDKIVLLGENDVAKSTLMKILMGEMEPDAGTVEWGVTITNSYFPKDNSSYFMDGKNDLVNWLRQYSENKDETFIRGFLGKMLFSGEEALKKTNVLSGGEKVRCMMSKLMLSGANVLLVDGPTDHLDLESITSVNEGFERFKGNLIFTSHDHEFIQTVANRIIDLDHTTGKVIEDKYVSYDDYLASKS
ncbi:ATP-binding cassette domain-containing protein [Halobacteriovorax sp. XZX-3]|uniref:ABC-F family ATP-binding cassette domain-containing protein n=1 Tax=unclassified Halobacteriovorax TaxID=2639665 RepID=UPI000CD289BD|nr:ATP-binding cassette domain-containing protein [Halobacteriovorax sp. DA5]POB13719.1 ABC transporter ATP-binding protein [Halobacteriovorax sp. DA5]